MAASSATKNKSIKESMKKTMAKRSLQTCAVYKVKIDESSLSKKQAEQLKMLFVEAKWLYNDILSYSRENSISTYDTKSKFVRVLNKDGEPETRELRFIGSQIKQSVLSGIQSAIKTLGTLKKKGHRVGRLKYLSDYKSIELKQFGATYQILGNKYMKIQRVSGRVRVNGLDQFVNIPNIEIANAKLLNTPLGYYVAITTYRFKDDLEPEEYVGPEIGVDMGVKSTITLSNGERFTASVGETERIKSLQRKLARQKKGSNNRRKTIRNIQREYQKLSNRKTDTANKIVAHILSFETVYMQNENISGWHKGWFGKQVQHSVLGRVKAKLVHHPRVNVLDRYAPTTKYCRACGSVSEDTTLADKVYTCNNCGCQEDRDIHAACNMIVIFKNQVPRGPRKLKPVETSTAASGSAESSVSAVAEAGSC